LAKWLVGVPVGG